MTNELRQWMTLVEADEWPVYHGTDQHFTTFDDAKRGSSTEHPTAQLGHFVTRDPQHAATYPARRQRRHVMSLLLRKGHYFKLPINQYYEQFPRRTPVAAVIAYREKLRREGYDGIEITASDDDDFPAALVGEVGTLIVFDATHLTHSQ
jgi:hypothetical protein